MRDTRSGRTIAVVMMAAIALLMLTAFHAYAKRGGEGGRGDGPIVYVTSQGLYYDSIVTADPLPAKGPFQLLEMGPNGLQTEFGPGDTEYRGGRWMEDIDDDGVIHYFSCPLLGPGREEP